MHEHAPELAALLWFTGWFLAVAVLFAAGLGLPLATRLSGVWTRLYAVGCELADLRWGSAGQRLPAWAVERHGYAKARRIGVMAAVGGKDKTRIRNATPVSFRDHITYR